MKTRMILWRVSPRLQQLRVILNRQKSARHRSANAFRNGFGRRLRQGVVGVSRGLISVGINRNAGVDVVAFADIVVG